MENESKPDIKTSEIVSGLTKSLKSSFLVEWSSTLIGFLSGSKSFYILLGLGIAIVYAGTLGAFDAFRMGYRHAYGVTREIPWGLLISTYIFFVATTTGLCIVSAIGHVFGVKDFMPIAKRSVFLSIATIIPGFTIIFFDIENPFRMALYNVISPGLTSNIWWMGTLYGVYMFFMIVEFTFILVENHKFATYFGLLGLIAGVAAQSNLGAIFGMLNGRGLWYGPYVPVYFIALAIVSGCAAIIFFTWLAYKITDEKMDRPMLRALEAVSKLCMLMIVIVLFLTGWNIITGLTGRPDKVIALKAMMTGPFAFNFWVVEILIGLVIPFVLFLFSKCRSVGLGFLASAMMLVSIFFMRYDLVVLGQVVPMAYDLGVREYPSLLTYTPTFHEISVVVAGLGICVTTFMIGEKVFRGHKSEIH